MEKRELEPQIQGWVNPAVWLRAALGRELPIKILRKCRYLRSLGLIGCGVRMACVLQIMLLSIKETSVSYHVLKLYVHINIHIYIYVYICFCILIYIFVNIFVVDLKTTFKWT